MLMFGLVSVGKETVLEFPKMISFDIFRWPFVLKGVTQMPRLLDNFDRNRSVLLLVDSMFHQADVFHLCFVFTILFS